MRFLGKIYPSPSASRRRRPAGVAIFLLALFFLFNPAGSVHAYSASDVKTVVNAYHSAFYSVAGTNGYFKDTQTGGIAYFWGQAEMIECVIDAYEWTGDPAYRGMITNLLNGFIKNNGSAWTSWNIYNDDIMWAVIAFTRGGVDTGNTNYCNLAKANFDACYARAWDNQLGGGFYWSTDNQSKNACANATAAIAAYLLYQVYGDVNYLNKATSLYNWERSVLFNPNTGAIYDAIGTNGVVNTWASTYNQGTFIGAAHFLGQTNDAMLAAQFTMLNLTSRGILPEYGIAGNNSGFNAIFLRWLTHFMKDRQLQSTYEPWLQLNATAAWNVRRSDNLSWCQWLHPSPAGTNFYAWDCIASYEAMLAADPTQGYSSLSVPDDFIGYWPLDAVSGTIATNAAGNGNNGTVNGASWNANGRINRCLNFNGLNSSVQIANPVGNDFSIAFWVKTTQTAGTPQWYSGAGLVDGDVPFSANDFGTALVGGKFAFGVGNPDTTIVSTTAINNGVWHHCVATRQEASGLLSVYVDGNLQATGTATKNTLSAPANLLFGVTGGNYFNGSLDEVKIFTRALASNEVAALYNSNLLSPSAGPASLTATAGNSRVSLSWSATAAATSYNVKRSLISGGPYVTITNVTATTYTDTNVLNSRTYYYVVSAVNAVGEGADSFEASASPSALTVWFKADAITGLVNGAAVSVWTDLTGNGYHAMQLLSGNRPTYVTSAINGQPAVHFNSASSSYLWFYRPVQDDFTMIFVYRSSQGIGTGVNFWEGAGLINGEVPNTVGDFGIALNANGQILAGTGNPDRTLSSGAGYNNGQAHVVTFKRIRSTGALLLYVDGALAATATGGTQSLTAPNQLVLGGQAVLNNFLTGDLVEVQVYNAPLSDTDRRGQENALKCKYGISGGAAPAAPTGLTGAAGNRKIALNWMLAAGATDYNLWRSTNKGASYQLLVTGLTTSSYVDTNAVNGQMNFYKIAATDACGAGVSSAATSVLLPLPALGISVSANALAIRWPDWASDWGLSAATNLTPPVVWSPLTNEVGRDNGQLVVSMPMNSSRCFFRLTAQ